MVLEKTLESPLDSKEIKPVNPKGNQPFVFIRSADAKAEAPMLGHMMEKPTQKRNLRCWERMKAGGEGDHRG